MKKAWEVRIEDIEKILNTHNSDADPQEVFNDFDQELRVEKAILWYQDPDSQEAAADDELEDILLEKGIISGRKLFRMP